MTRFKLKTDVTKWKKGSIVTELDILKWVFDVLKEMLAENGVFDDSFEELPDEPSTDYKLSQEQLKIVCPIAKELFLIPAVSSWSDRFKTKDEVLAYNQGISDFLYKLERPDWNPPK